MEAHWPAYGSQLARIWKPAGPHMEARRPAYGGWDGQAENRRPIAVFCSVFGPLVRGYALPNRKPVVEVRKGEET